MKRRVFLAGLLTLTTAGNVGILAASAGAMPPDHHSETIFEHEHFSCAKGVELDEQGPVLTLNGITFFDGSGNPIRDVEEESSMASSPTQPRASSSGTANIPPSSLTSSRTPSPSTDRVFSSTPSRRRAGACPGRRSHRL